MLQALCHEALRLHADDAAALLQCALGQQSHEAGFGAAVDQRVACGTDPCSQFPDGLRQMGVGAAAGAQIYGDVHRRYLRG